MGAAIATEMRVRGRGALMRNTGVQALGWVRCDHRLAAMARQRTVNLLPVHQSYTHSSQLSI